MSYVCVCVSADLDVVNAFCCVMQIHVASGCIRAVCKPFFGTDVMTTVKQLHSMANKGQKTYNEDSRRKAYQIDLQRQSVLSYVLFAYNFSCYVYR